MQKVKKALAVVMAALLVFAAINPVVFAKAEEVEKGKLTLTIQTADSYPNWTNWNAQTIANALEFRLPGESNSQGIGQSVISASGSTIVVEFNVTDMHGNYHLNEGDTLRVRAINTDSYGSISSGVFSDVTLSAGTDGYAVAGSGTLTIEPYTTKTIMLKPGDGATDEELRKGRVYAVVITGDAAGQTLREQNVSFGMYTIPNNLAQFPYKGDQVEFHYNLDGYVEHVWTETMNTISMAHTVPLIPKKDSNVSSTTESISMAYGDQLVLDDYITAAEGYDGVYTYAVEDGKGDYATIDGNIIQAKNVTAEDESIKVSVTALETATFKESTTEIFVNITKKDLGEIGTSDLIPLVTPISINYADVTTGANKFSASLPLSSYYISTWLAEGPSFALAYTYDNESAINVGTNTASVVIIEEGRPNTDLFQYTVKEEEPTAISVTVTTMPVVISVKDSIEIEYGSNDWNTLMKGEIPGRFLDDETLYSISEYSSSTYAGQRLTEMWGGNLKDLVSVSLSSEKPKYKTGTYTGEILLTMKDGIDQGNYLFSLSAPHVTLNVVNASFESNVQAWSYVDFIAADSQNAYKAEDGTVYIAEDGIAVFEAAPGHLFDGLVINGEGTSVDKDTLEAPFYLYDTENPDTRSDANRGVAGDQDNMIPAGAIVVDTTAPSVTFDICGSSVLPEEFSFETTSLTSFNNTDTAIEVSVTDDLSGVDSVTYKIVNDEEEFSFDGMEFLPEDGIITVTKAGLNVVVVTVTDNVGNVITYISDIIMIETSAPAVSTVGVSNGDYFAEETSYKIIVSDADSGIVSVGVAMVADGNLLPEGSFIQTEDLTVYEGLIGSAESLEYLGTQYEVEATIPAVDSNNVVITISVVDKAGNVTILEHHVSVDVIAPTIKVEYDNNAPLNDVYFNSTRTATITFVDRNFVEDNATVTITKNGTPTEYTIAQLVDGVDGGNIVMTKLSDSEEGEDEEQMTAKRTVIYSLAFGKKDKTDADYQIGISVVDRAGNETSEIDFGASTPAEAFVVDSVNPAISVNYLADGDQPVGDGDILTSVVRPTITIRERNFYEAGLEVNVSITDIDGNTIGSYTANPAWSTNETVHTAVLSDMNLDGIYAIDISCMDLAGNSTSVETFSFVIDRTLPTGSLLVGSTATTTTDKNASFTQIGNKPVTISLSGADSISGVKSIQYYLYDPGETVGVDFIVPTDETTLSKFEWTKVEGNDVTIETDSQQVVYIRIEDNAGNVTYINSSDAILVDMTSASTPQISISGAENGGIYAGNVPITISVVDPTVGGTYSGLKSVRYEVLSDGVVTQTGNYDAEFTHARIQSVVKSETVYAAQNNSNNVLVRVIVTDFAGNTVSAEKSLSIDVTAPTMTLTYDNNTAVNSSYYAAARTATLTISERNLRAEDVTISVSSTHGSVATIGTWNMAENMGVSDNAQSSVTITFAADDDYQISVSCVDISGNTAVLGRTDSFTIDTTKPVINVTFDNNTVCNGMYYNQDRTATITVTERNFDEALFSSNIVGLIDGETIDSPELVGWTHDGDRHVATIKFTKEGEYNASFTVSDKASNLSEEARVTTFIVDKTMPVISVSGIMNGQAYNDSIAPVITYSDRNRGDGKVSVVLSGAAHQTQILSGTLTETENGGTLTLADFTIDRETDDLYTLTVSFEDLAGNKAEKKITFSINRFGSFYGVEESTQGLIGGYHQSVGDIVVYETNINSLTETVVTLGRDGAAVTLVKDIDYTVEESKDEYGRSVYKYTIFASCFTEDGMYEVMLSSKDSAGNTMDNTVKQTPIRFVIDTTAPSCQITGVNDGGRYTTQTIDYHVAVSDNIGIEKVIVYVDGVEVATYTKEQVAAVGGDIPLTLVASNSYQTIKAVAEDAAGNRMESEDVRVLVSSNLAVQLINNVGILVTLIAVVVAGVGGGVFFYIKKKKKN